MVVGSSLAGFFSSRGPICAVDKPSAGPYSLEGLRGPLLFVVDAIADQLRGRYTQRSAQAFDRRGVPTTASTFEIRDGPCADPRQGRQLALG